jgi:YD repeat-containing protein
VTRLRIRHETTYTYSSPVSFGPWRLLMRPADTHGERVIEASFELSPPGATRWTYDAYGNSVCHFTPQGPSTQLRVVNHLLIDRFPAPLSPLSMDDPRSLAPIVYEGPVRTVLAPFITPATDEYSADYLDWLRANASGRDEPALDYIMRFNRAIHETFGYASRNEYGTQSPVTTFALGTGACRDLAWLMIESLRRFGFAARFVTGYLYSGGASGIKGAGATHAWCEVFLPDLGWIECDPTNGLVESQDLIRVAYTRTPEEASPMDGVVFGGVGEGALFVDVSVERADDFAAAAF